MKVLFLQTGGTIDKAYIGSDDNHGYNFVIDAPASDRILQRVHPNIDIETQTVLRKDSLDITDSDRELIVKACRQSDVERIVITHGTDTMIQTAALLSQLNDKTIVLTGAMTPELFRDSDADFNLGTALGAACVAAPGVYIAMNAHVMKWDEVEFSTETGQFVLK